MFAVNPPIANTPSKGVIGECEVLAERQPMLEAGALRDVQAKGRRLRQDGVDSVVFIGWVGQFANPTKQRQGSALFPSAENAYVSGLWMGRMVIALDRSRRYARVEATG